MAEQTMETSNVVLLYVTAPDEEMALKLGATLVEERLAACVNILPSMKSVYRWDEKIQIGTEAVLIVKTTLASAPKAKDRLLADHPFDVPCILEIPVYGEASNPAFLDWIYRETRL